MSEDRNKARDMSKAVNPVLDKILQESQALLTPAGKQPKNKGGGSKSGAQSPRTANSSTKAVSKEARPDPAAKENARENVREMARLAGELAKGTSKATATVTRQVDDVNGDFDIWQNENVNPNGRQQASLIDMCYAPITGASAGIMPYQHGGFFPINANQIYGPASMASMGPRQHWLSDVSEDMYEDDVISDLADDGLVTADDGNDGVDGLINECLSDDGNDTVNEVVADEDDDADILGMYGKRYEDEDGPALHEGLAKLANSIWGKGRDPKTIKEMMEKHPRPSNVKAQKVNINPEVLNGLQKPARIRDIKLRAIQNCMARATVPPLKIAEKLLDKNTDKLTKTMRKDLVDMAMDTMAFLSNANEAINQLRRDTLRTGMQPKFQSLCQVPKGIDTSELLFSQNLEDRIKAVAQGGKLSRYATHQTYRGRGRGYFYHPYMPVARGSYRGRGFLGKGSKMQGDAQCNPHMTTANDHKIDSLEQQTDDKNDNQNAIIQTALTEDVLPINACGFRTAVERAELQGPTQARPALEQRVTPITKTTTHGNAEVGKCPKPFPKIDVDRWGSMFQAGRVSNCVEEWAKITSDRLILNDIRNFKLQFIKPPTQQYPLPELRFSPAEQNFLRSEIASLLDKNVLERAEHVPGEFISNIFLREKREKGKYRMILNLKHLNKSVEKIHFKMDTLMSTLALVTPGCSFLSFDFSDAYYSCGVFPPHRKYLRFLFEGVLYEFTCLPNGLTSAPRFFTKIMKVALSHLRKSYGVTISGYLDDILLNNVDTADAMLKGVQAAELFQNLGFTINVPKSVIFPTTRIEHLGFIIDSVSMMVSMTPEKTNKIIELVQDCLTKEKMTIRMIARIIGKINATRPANKWAALFTKQLEIEKNYALFANKFNYDAFMEVSKTSSLDLQWVLENLADMSAPVRTPQVDYVIYTDASTQGWGCYDAQTKQSAGGRWSQTEQQLHINCLELKAALFGLLSLCSEFHGRHIRVMTDNTTALASINKQGSTKSQPCNEVTRQIWDFALQNDLWFSAAFCPGVENTEADSASRLFDDHTEWALKRDIFDYITQEMGCPTIDLFASRLNKKVENYCAWQPDPAAIYIDAFMYHWGGEQFVYAFPPFSVIHMVVQKIIQDEARGILVIPDWPTQPWYTLVKSLLCKDPLVISVTNDELYLPFRVEDRHPMTGRLTLLACHFNARHYEMKAFHPQSSTPWWDHDGKAQTNFITLTWRDG